MKRILVCGCRDWCDPAPIKTALIDETVCQGEVIVIHGGAGGADAIAGSIARDLGHTVRVFHADWKAHGRAAGPRRNAEMLARGMPDVVLAFWDGRSRGTLDMIRRAVEAGVPVRAFPRATNVQPPESDDASD